MVGAGLVLPSFDESLALLRNLNSTAESARAALSEFIEILGADRRFYAIGVEEVYEKISFDLPIFPLEGAIEVLSHLSQQHQLALVTIGKPVLQMEKLKKAGIDSRIFSKIAVVDEKDKKPYYQRIVDDLGYSASEVVVCGDRIHVDLIPARELGFKTILMKWGRGLSASNYRGDVDYSISQMSELKGILSSLVTFSSLS